MSRKINDIWAAIDDQRDTNMFQNQWRSSYAGVKAALLYIGLVLVTTEKELDAMDLHNYSQSSHRNVIVSRNGVLSKPTRIHNFLTGNSLLLTPDEIAAINNKRSEDEKQAKPKGVATCNTIEDDTVRALDELVDMNSIFDRVFLDENRLSDVAYCEKGANPEDDVFFAEQIKSATVSGKAKSLTFNA